MGLYAVVTYQIRGDYNEPHSDKGQHYAAVTYQIRGVYNRSRPAI